MPEMEKPKNRPDVSDAAVEKATGRGWDGWTSFLDGCGARECTHKEIVTLVRERGRVENGWWQQTVAVGYEKIAGLRTTGQTKETGFQIGVQRTIDADLEAVWEWLTSPAGVETWLGSGEDPVWEDGSRFELEGGGRAEVRVVRPGERLRVAWQPSGWSRPATIQLRVESKGARTLVAFHEENLPSQEKRSQRRDHFTAALTALREALA